MNPIKDIVIVGGGTAGLISALYLNQFFPNKNITLIKSDKIGIIGVGEGSTEHFEDFIVNCKINHKELIKETGATVKYGILFNKWNSPNHSYIHSIESVPNINDNFNTIDGYNFLLDINKNNKFPLSPLFENIGIKNNVALNHNLNPTFQYHFDTFKLNKFLLKKCIDRKIICKDYFIKDIKLNKKGYIESLITSNDKKIKGDFFIDCTGFKRIFSSKLNNKWVSYTKYLPLNRAITLSTPLNLNKGIEPYTTSTALSSGWAWKIPTQTRYGNGYVFSDNYISPDQALKEFNQHLNTDIESSSKDIKFEAGKVNKFWDKNYVSIGLAGSFVEPLEAQSISFSIIQSELLIFSLNSYTTSPTTISKKYNEILNQSFENMVSFVQAHYLTKRKDSKFWKEKPYELTPFNKEILPIYKKGLFPGKIIGDEQKNFLLFKQLNWYQLLAGLDLLNLDSIKSTLHNLPSQYFQETWDKLSYENNKIQMPNIISHINYLKLVKQNTSF